MAVDLNEWLEAQRICPAADRQAELSTEPPSSVAPSHDSLQSLPPVAPMA